MYLQVELGTEKKNFFKYVMPVRFGTHAEVLMLGG